MPGKCIHVDLEMAQCRVEFNRFTQPPSRAVVGPADRRLQSKAASAIIS
jgi:hypothetical protein